MIIAKIQGGLGNQLFQYAFARAISKKNKTNLKLDLSFYENMGAATPRKYSLSNYNIWEEYATEVDVERIKNRVPGALNKIFRKVTPMFCSNYREDNRVFDRKALRLSDNCYIEGYWQNFRYFRRIEPLIREELTLKCEVNQNTPILEQIKNTNSVSIHFRKTDYCSLGLDRGCNEEYYQKALNLVVSKVNDPELFIFSDDIDWAKKNIRFNYKTTFVSDEDFIELYLMSCCKHNIIANSSFSWWGAWLNTHRGKVVVAPKAWPNPKAVSKIYPKGWKVI